MGEVQRLQARVAALESQLANAQTEASALRSELQSRDAEVERLRRVNRDLQLGHARGETGAGAAVSLASVEGDLAQLLERLRTARVQADGMQSQGDHGDVTRSPTRARVLASKGTDGQLPPISAADEAWLRHGAGGADGGNDTEGDSASVGEEERHRDHTTDWTRRANSSVPFDTLSQASLNTDDGRLTYSNSEYTQHLGALSDQEEDPSGAAASPRSSVSLPATAVPPMLLDAQHAALQARRGAGVRS